MTNIADVQVVPNANFTSVPSVNHNVVPNRVLPTTSAVMCDQAMVILTAELGHTRVNPSAGHGSSMIGMIKISNISYIHCKHVSVTMHKGTSF